jgi:thiamine biosynthesis lipoprotein ApbE
VTGPDLGLADALATAVAVAGQPGLAMIEPLDGYEALVISPDGTKQWTQGFPFAEGNRPHGDEEAGTTG